MECLKENKQLAEKCTEVAKTYLMCRMDAYASATLLDTTRTGTLSASLDRINALSGINSVQVVSASSSLRIVLIVVQELDAEAVPARAGARGTVRGSQTRHST